MKPFGLFKLLYNAKSRDEFIKILKENRTKTNLNNRKKENMRQNSTQQ